ncbi:MAG: hypothetical protein IEMM0008_1448 [bacterium]|nr:MAG: hypothetical protein IEMM0008_1448 [bacterium]
MLLTSKRIKSLISITFLIAILIGCNSNHKPPGPILPSSILITSPGLYPEGLAYDSSSHIFYISSIKKGKITKVTLDGKHQVFADDHRLISSIGIKVDKERNRLIVCVADPGVGEKSSKKTRGTLAGLMIYNLKNGKKVKYINLGKMASGPHVANDLALDNNGNIYITDSFSPIIYKVSQKGKTSILINDDQLAAPKGAFGLNGILYHPNGYLIVSNYATKKLFKIPLTHLDDLKEIKINQDAFAEDILAADGLILMDPQTLILASNNLAGGSNGVYKLTSSDDWSSAAVIDKFKTGNTFPTTLAKAGDQVFVLYSKLHMLFGGNKPEAKKFVIRKVQFNR